MTGLPSDRRSIASVDTPAIDYRGTASPDAVAQLARQIENGRASLEFDRDTGYLPAILRALHVDEASQMLVFSKTSVQQSRINPDNPREDLRSRLMRYPCSYMIYSNAFDALPDQAKQAIYARMWEVLSGKDKDPRYEKITRSDRRGVIEILRSTKPDLPGYFR